MEMSRRKAQGYSFTLLKQYVIEKDKDQLEKGNDYKASMLMLIVLPIKVHEEEYSNGK